MAGPRELGVRPPAVAGLFYPADPQQCQAAARMLLVESKEAAGCGMCWRGAIVPHAGWICSGALAGEAIATLAATAGPVDVVVVFGAIHTPIPVDRAALDVHASWATPGSETRLDVELSRMLTDGSRWFVQDERLHSREHAVEVEVPLIQQAFAGASILPVEVPVVEQAVEIGRHIARQVRAAGLKAVFLASSDLTHYGPNYRFVPGGIGPAGLQWAKENDRRLLQVVTDMAAERVVPEVGSRFNACGGGAIAAMLAACRELGATTARVLRHANSFETLASVAPQAPDNAVGYAAVVVGTARGDM